MGPRGAYDRSRADRKRVRRRFFYWRRRRDVAGSLDRFFTKRDGDRVKSWNVEASLEREFGR